MENKNLFLSPYLSILSYHLIYSHFITLFIHILSPYLFPSYHIIYSHLITLFIHIL